MNEMTSKQRLLAAIRGEEVDHVPFSPFLAYYFDFLPKSVRKKGGTCPFAGNGSRSFAERGNLCL